MKSATANQSGALISTGINANQFNAREISGLVLWINPSAEIGRSENDEVDSLLDFSSWDQVITQGNSSERTTFHYNVEQSRSVIRSPGGSSKYLSIAYSPIIYMLPMTLIVRFLVNILPSVSLVSNGIFRIRHDVSPFYGLQLRVNNSDRFEVRVRDSASIAKTLADTTDIQPQTWYSFAMRISNTTIPIVNIFRDGVQVASTTVDQSSLFVHNGSSHLMRIDSSSYIDGDLSSFMIFNRALSDHEIRMVSI